MSDGFEPSISVYESVFNTVELLDLILGHILLDRKPYDGQILRWALNLQRINKTFYNHIHGSTSTAVELFLRPKPPHIEGTFLMKEVGFLSEKSQPAIWRSWNSKYVPRGRYRCLMRFRISSHEAFAEVPSYGDMFLAQPPITQVWIQGMGFCGTAGIAGKYIPLHLKPMLLTRPGGIKVRDAFAAARSILRRLGGRAERENVFFWARLDKNGTLFEPENDLKGETVRFLPDHA